MWCLPFWKKKENKEQIAVDDIKAKLKPPKQAKREYVYYHRSKNDSKEVNFVTNADKLKPKSKTNNTQTDLDKKSVNNKKNDLKQGNLSKVTSGDDTKGDPRKTNTDKSDKLQNNKSGIKVMCDMIRELSTIQDEVEPVGVGESKDDLQSEHSDMSIPSIQSSSESITTENRNNGFDILIDPDKLDEFFIFDIDDYAYDGGSAKEWRTMERKTGLPINRVQTAFKNRTSFLQYEKKRVSFYKDDVDAIVSDNHSQRYKYSPFTSFAKFDPMIHSRDFREAIAKLPPRTVKPIWTVEKQKNTLQKLSRKQKTKVESMANIYSVKRRDSINDNTSSIVPINEGSSPSSPKAKNKKKPELKPIQSNKHKLPPVLKQ